MDRARFCRIVAWTVLGVTVAALSILGIHTAVYWFLRNVVAVTKEPVTVPNIVNPRDVGSISPHGTGGRLSADLQEELVHLRAANPELAALWEAELDMSEGAAYGEDEEALWRREEDRVGPHGTDSEDEGDEEAEGLPPVPKVPLPGPPKLPTNLPMPPRLPLPLPTKLPGLPKLPPLPPVIPTKLPKLPKFPNPLPPVPTQEPTKLPKLPKFPNPLPKEPTRGPLPTNVPTDAPTPPPVKKPGPPPFKLPGFISVPARLLQILKDAIYRLATTAGLPSEMRDVLMFMYHLLQRITGGSSVPQPDLPVPVPVPVPGPTFKGRWRHARPTPHPAPLAPGAAGGEGGPAQQLGVDGAPSGFVSVVRRSVDVATEAGIETAAAASYSADVEGYDDDNDEEDGPVDAMRKKPLSRKMRKDLLSLAAYEISREIAGSGDKGGEDEADGGLITVPACMAIFQLLLRHTEAWMGTPRSPSKGRKEKGNELGDEDGLVEAVERDEAWGLIDEVYF